MEKKRMTFFACFKTALVAALILFSHMVNGQKMRTFKGHCGAFYENMAHLYKIAQAELDFYQFKPGQTIASIGAQCCHWEGAYAATTDSVTFYLQDIDTGKFKKQQAEFAWNYYAQLRGKPMTSNY